MYEENEVDDFVHSLSPKGARAILKALIMKLDEDDLDDFFGTEGWRHRYGFEGRIPG